MKASKKLILVSAATIMLTVPVLANNHLSNPVVAASQDNTQTTKLTFYINHNAYVYNHQGKRTKSKIKKGKLLKVTILKPKAITNPNQSRYFFNNVLAGKYFSLPTVSIKKTDFVNIGKNKYIKPGNIGRISPGKYQYADLSTKEIKVITKKTAPVTNQIGMPIAAPIKKGTKLTVDQNYYHNVDGADDYLSSLEYYRIKGTDKWVNLPAIKKSTRIMPNNFALAASTEDNYVIAGNSTYLYNIDGEIVDKSYLLITDVNVGVDRALYIWNKQTKQADLYYHLTANKKLVWVPALDGTGKTGTTITSNGSYAHQTKDTANTFVKASDVTSQNPVALKVDNTPSEAQADASQATASDYGELQALVDRAGQIKKSTLYRLTEKAQQERYDLAVDNAQKLLTNKNTSIAAVKQASWQIKYDQSKLDGQKVWVKNMNKLTKAEKSWVVSLANCDIHGDLQKEYAGFYKGKIAVVTYNKKTFKSELVRYLKLSDYATDK